MSSIFDKLLTVVYPKRCALCGEVIAFDGRLCEECEAEKRIEGEICLKCGREKERCVCKKEHFSPSYKGFCAPYYFSGSMQKAVYRLKNSGFEELAPPMASVMAETVKKRFENTEFDCVTCVPMTKRRRRKRGYNQSELLAKALAKELKLPYEALLVKSRDTKAQRLSTAKDRRTNLYGAFEAAHDAKLKDKTVLIADDVKTTGSTLSECAKMLRIHGARAVYACAFTVTDKK